MIKKFDFKKTTNVEIVNEVLLDSVKMGASKVYMRRCEEGLKLQFEIEDKLQDYTLVPYVEKPYKYVENFIIRLKLIFALNIVETNKKQEGKLKTVIQGIENEQKIETIPTAEREEVIITNYLIR